MSVQLLALSSAYGGGATDVATTRTVTQNMTHPMIRTSLAVMARPPLIAICTVLQSVRESFIALRAPTLSAC